MASYQKKWKNFLKEDLTVRVHGYLKPTSSFRTLTEWKEFVEKGLDLQEKGMSIRGGEVEGEEFNTLVNDYFDFQLNTDVPRYDLLTKKNVLDFIEDFINHRFWGLKREFGTYFPIIEKLRFSYFYSRGDMEPYVLVDDEFTKQIYGDTDRIKTLQHYTSNRGVERIQNAIESGNSFDISAFTVMKRPFFRKESDKIMVFKGEVKAAFRSDVKSYATDSGRKAINLYRLEYPNENKSNICDDLETACSSDTRTTLWNEIIATPLEILEIKE